MPEDTFDDHDGDRPAGRSAADGGRQRGCDRLELDGKVGRTPISHDIPALPPSIGSVT